MSSRCWKPPLRWTLMAAVALLLGACATAPVEPVGPPPDAVRNAPDRHAGAMVKWGGTIAGVRNLRDRTEIEVVAATLNRSGRPGDSDTRMGRFIAVANGFLDPAIYAEGRDVTVEGTVAGTDTREVGDYPYRFPVVEADHVTLWKPPVERYRDPFYPYGYWPYDPWDPWRFHRPWPYRPYPYW